MDSPRLDPIMQRHYPSGGGRCQATNGSLQCTRGLGHEGERHWSWDALGRFREWGAAVGKIEDD